MAAVGQRLMDEAEDVTGIAQSLIALQRTIVLGLGEPVLPSLSHRARYRFGPTLAALPSAVLPGVGRWPLIRALPPCL